jgi:N-acetylmuramoyl-L-alanine amidase
MRKINFIVVHCTATHPNATLASIKNYWKTALHWKNYGYHYIIDVDGNLTKLTDENELSNGVQGHNHESINVAYIGGLDVNLKPKDTRNYNQVTVMFKLLYRLKKQYPNAVILGHRDFAEVKKACPCFDAKNEYKSLNCFPLEK